MRYRWGYLSIRVSLTPSSDVFSAVGGHEVYGKQLGEEYDGLLKEEELVALTSHLIEWFPR